MRNTLEFLIRNNITTLLDIGANVGVFSSVMKNHKPDLDIFMLEANPFCDSMLNRTGIPYEIACLSNESKEVKLYINRKNMICTGVSYYQEQTIHYSPEDYMLAETKLLDDVVLKRFGKQKAFEFIKMDTQGSELDIIRGGMKTIEQAKHIQIEVTLIEYNKGSPLIGEVVSFMKEIGFRQNEKVETLYQSQDPSTGIVIQEDWIFSR